MNESGEQWVKDNKYLVSCIFVSRISICVMSNESILKQKSLCFAQRIVRLYRFLNKEYRETVMSKQILRSGTSIGANISEAIYASSRRDFVAKLHISRKETAETVYWLDLLYSCSFLTETQYRSMKKDCMELMAILSATIKTCESGDE